MKEITSAFTCLACKVRQDFACEVRQDFVPQVQVKLSMQVPIWGSYFILGPEG